MAHHFVLQLREELRVSEYPELDGQQLIVAGVLGKRDISLDETVEKLFNDFRVYARK